MSLLSRASSTASKLTSPSPEVRHRALANLLTKCEASLVQPGELAGILVSGAAAAGAGVGASGGLQEEKEEGRQKQNTLVMELLNCVEKVRLV